MSGQSLPRAERLRGKARFDALFQTGRLGKSRRILVRALPNGLPISRVGVVTPRKTGCAVVRNRVRRRLRAIWRELADAVPGGWDVILLARRGAVEADHETLARDARVAIERCLHDDGGE